VESTFELAIGTAGNEDHHDQADQVRNYHRKSNNAIRRVMRERFDDLRRPEAEGVHANVHKETDTTQMPHACIGEDLKG
jgi:hypothetical protein